MPVLEQVKRLAERATGIGRPAQANLDRLVRRRTPRAFRFADDGRTPNNPCHPLLHYKGVVQNRRGLDPAAVLEDLFALNGWKGSWRDGIYDFLHFHTGTHEVLGIARGKARVQFGGLKGRTVTVAAGDVLVLPAGTGHQRIAASKDLLVVGAYPAGGAYDEPEPGDVDHAKARKKIARVSMPAKDPVYGKDGPLRMLWKPK